MYTCNKFGTELKDKIQKNENFLEIESWIYSMFFYYKDSLTPLLINKLDTIVSKDNNQKTFFTKEFLLEIADDMIAVKIDSLDKNSTEYLKIIFGEMLKEKLEQLIPADEIGKWAFDYYFTNMNILDDEFADLLQTLSLMDAGPEFEYTYDQLNKFADDLIAGKNVTV